MKKEELVSSIIRNFFIIFTIVVLGTGFLNPSHTFTYPEVLLAALFSLAGDLPTLVYYSKKELTEKSKKIRTVVHFILIETVLLTFANLVGQVSGLMETFLFGVEVLVIVMLVGFFTWLIDRKTAHDINKRLEELRREKSSKLKS